MTEWQRENYLKTGHFRGENGEEMKISGSHKDLVLKCKNFYARTLYYVTKCKYQLDNHHFFHDSCTTSRFLKLN